MLPLRPGRDSNHQSKERPRVACDSLIRAIEAQSHSTLPLSSSRHFTSVPREGPVNNHASFGVNRLTKCFQVPWHSNIPSAPVSRGRCGIPSGPLAESQTPALPFLSPFPSRSRSKLRPFVEPELDQSTVSHGRGRIAGRYSRQEVYRWRGRMYSLSSRSMSPRQQLRLRHSQRSLLFMRVPPPTSLVVTSSRPRQPDC